MKSNSLMNSLFGIIPAFFFNAPSASQSAETSGDDSQLTGVARYLQKLEPQVIAAADESV